MAGMQDLINAVWALGFAGILGVIMLTVMGSLDATGDALLFLGNATEGLINMAGQFGLIGTVVALGVVIVVVVTAFAMSGMFGGRR